METVKEIVHEFLPIKCNPLKYILNMGHKGVCVALDYRRPGKLDYLFLISCVHNLQVGGQSFTNSLHQNNMEVTIKTN